MMFFTSLKMMLLPLVAMMRCLPPNVAKPRIIRAANIIRRSRHHLPEANIIQNTHLCLGRQRCVFCCLKRVKRCLSRGKNEQKVSEKFANYKCESCFIDKSFSYFMLIDLCSAILTIYHTFSISVLKSITNLPI